MFDRQRSSSVASYYLQTYLLAKIVICNFPVTTVLVQQDQNGDFKQNDMASFAEALYKATKSEQNLFLWV